MDMVDREKVAQFKARSQLFAREFEKLENRSAEIPEKWRADYEKLISRGSDVKGRIQAAAASIDTSYKFARDTMKIPAENINSLGFLPLIPLAFIAGSTAVTAYFVTDAQKFNAKVDELERLQQMGYDKDKAAEIADRGVIAVPNSIAGVWNNKMLRFAGLGLVAWWGYNKYIKKGK